MPQGIYICSILLTYFIGITLISLDEQYHSNYLYGNLPVSRTQIVLARYLCLFLLSTLMVLCLAIVGLLSPNSQEMSASFFLLSLICYSIVLIFLSGMQAFSFYFKFNTVRYCSLAIYIILFSAYTLLSTSLQNTALPTIASIIVILPIVAILCYLACTGLGLLLYQKKQFFD